MKVLRQLEQSFNNHDIELQLDCFNDDCVASNLAQQKEIFKSKNELNEQLESLFSINPDLKCELSHITDKDPFATFRMKLWDYACGAEHFSVWSCLIKNNRISKLWLTK